MQKRTSFPTRFSTSALLLPLIHSLSAPCPSLLEYRVRHLSEQRCVRTSGEQDGNTWRQVSTMELHSREFSGFNGKGARGRTWQEPWSQSCGATNAKALSSSLAVTKRCSDHNGC